MNFLRKVVERLLVRIENEAARTMLSAIHDYHIAGELSLLQLISCFSYALRALFIQKQSSQAAPHLPAPPIPEGPFRFLRSTPADWPGVEEAKWAIVDAFLSIEFNPNDGSAFVPGVEDLRCSFTINSFHDLRDFLIERANEEYYAYTVFDGGAAHFEDRSDDWVDEFLLNEKVDFLQKMGWDID